MQINADISPWITACDQKRHKNEIRTLKIQIKITIDRVRLKVTVCLYPNPSNRARSLSTLITVRHATNAHPSHITYADPCKRAAIWYSLRIHD